MIGNYFSAKTCQFFIGALKQEYISAGTWPDDAMKIDSSVEAEYSSTPPEGMILGADSSGLPAWVDKPAPTHEELVEQAEAKRQALIDAAMASISLIQLKLRAERNLTQEETTRLNAVLDYIDAVEAIDTSNAPDIEWPVSP